MAKIPLLECLTRHSYRECLEKSCSTPEKDSDETEEEKSTDSVIRPSETQQRISKLPASFSALGATSLESADTQETNEMTDSSGLRAALQEEDSPERAAPPSFNVTLLDWINVQDRPNDVESVVRKCFDSINRVSLCMFCVGFRNYAITWLSRHPSCLLNSILYHSTFVLFRSVFNFRLKL